MMANCTPVRVPVSRITGETVSKGFFTYLNSVCAKPLNFRKFFELFAFCSFPPLHFHFDTPIKQKSIQQLTRNQPEAHQSVINDVTIFVLLLSPFQKCSYFRDVLNKICCCNCPITLKGYCKNTRSTMSVF